MKMRFIVFILSFFLVSVPVMAQQQPQVDQAKQWQALVDQNKKAEAEKLCSGWLKETENISLIEAHKCLANTVLKTRFERKIKNDTGTEVTVQSFPDAEIVAALGHINEVLRLKPDDLGSHLGRLDIFMLAGRYNDLPEMLEDSIQKIQQSDALDYWLAYATQLFQEKQFQAAILYTKVLEKKFPDDYRILGKLGAYYTMLQQDALALDYLQRAVKKKPDDVMINWNLARLYDYTNDVKKADALYKKSLKLFAASPDEPLIKEHCVYADFVDARLKDHPQACEYRKQYCVEDVAMKCR